MFKQICAAAAAAFVMHGASALTIGGLTFEQEAFADSLISSTGEYVTSYGTLAEALTDGSLGSWAMSNTPGASVVLGFTDNLVVNGAGDDIALFEVGHEAYEYSQEGFDSFNVTINGITRLYFTTETTTIVDDHNVNMTRLDLSHFGIADGATIDRIQIGMDYQTRDSLPQLSLVAAINSVAAPVPEPETYGLMLLGLAGIAAVARRRAAR